MQKQNLKGLEIVKIGIISDTHSKITKAKKAIDMLVEKDVEFIIHAGDIVKKENLDLLKNSNKPYVAVYGNNDASLLRFQDSYNLVEEPHYFKLADTKFKLMHHPRSMFPDVEIIIFGHTHKHSSQMINGTLFLNPGESCGRNTNISTCAMLEIKKNKFIVSQFSRAKGDDNFSCINYDYKRVKNE